VDRARGGARRPGGAALRGGAIAGAPAARHGGAMRRGEAREEHGRDVDGAASDARGSSGWARPVCVARAAAATAVSGERGHEEGGGEGAC